DRLDLDRGGACQCDQVVGRGNGAGPGDVKRGVAPSVVDRRAGKIGALLDVIDDPGIILPGGELLVVAHPIVHVAGVVADVDVVQDVSVKTAEVRRQPDELAHVLIANQYFRC